ncbi:MAG: AAA family ATPase [Phycisphaerae bacterium]|nr:AAA family ATPase [Phycisphaerae bacterium]
MLDEIQFAPELVAAIKRRVDRKRTPGQYVLTGSPQGSVLKSASESLAGPVVFLDLEGFSLAEIAEATTAEHWLRRHLDDPDGFVVELRAGIERIELPRTVYKQLGWGVLPEANVSRGAINLSGDTRNLRGSARYGACVRYRLDAEPSTSDVARSTQAVTVIGLRVVGHEDLPVLEFATNRIAHVRPGAVGLDHKLRAPRAALVGADDAANPIGYSSPGKNHEDAPVVQPDRPGGAIETAGECWWLAGHQLVGPGTRPTPAQCTAVRDGDRWRPCSAVV